MHAQPGWLYVGDGWLRYRDADGWTEHYMDTMDPRAQNWPPPEPNAMLQEADEVEQGTPTGRLRGVRRFLSRMLPLTGRHRSA